MKRNGEVDILMKATFIGYSLRNLQPYECFEIRLVFLKDASMCRSFFILSSIFMYSEQGLLVFTVYEVLRKHAVYKANVFKEIAPFEGLLLMPETTIKNKALVKCVRKRITVRRYRCRINVHFYFFVLVIYMFSQLV